MYLSQHIDNVLVLVTEWQEFISLDYVKMAKLMKHAVMIDGRNFLEPKMLIKAGFQYLGIGR